MIKGAAVFGTGTLFGFALGVVGGITVGFMVGIFVEDEVLPGVAEKQQARKQTSPVNNIFTPSPSDPADGIPT